MRGGTGFNEDSSEAICRAREQEENLLLIEDKSGKFVNDLMAKKNAKARLTNRGVTAAGAHPGMKIAAMNQGNRLLGSSPYPDVDQHHYRI